MAKLTFQGPLHLRVASFITLNKILISTALRHLMGRQIAPDWDVLTETGIRFWRHQFTRAMGDTDMAKGRAILHSLLTKTDDAYRVRVTRDDDGIWFTPQVEETDCILLYCHGGGYTFNGPVSERFAAMLAHHTGTRLYMPHYRLTPEHPHPAQLEDALVAWHRLRGIASADKITLIGDSAGGHLVLSLLKSLGVSGLEQPNLCIALCPWTDIGDRGASLVENNRYDLVQDWMALRFGEWLDPEGIYGREALSPIYQDYRGLAPIYMQAGGREILRDMIIDFADVQARRNADVMLDIWDDMPHNFQAYDSERASSAEALERIRIAVHEYSGAAPKFGPQNGRTMQVAGCFLAEENVKGRLETERAADDAQLFAPLTSHTQKGSLP